MDQLCRRNQTFASMASRIRVGYLDWSLKQRVLSTRFGYDIFLIQTSDDIPAIDCHGEITPLLSWRDAGSFCWTWGWWRMVHVTSCYYWMGWSLETLVFVKPQWQCWFVQTKDSQFQLGVQCTCCSWAFVLAQPAKTRMDLAGCGYGNLSLCPCRQESLVGWVSVCFGSSFSNSMFGHSEFTGYNS